MKYIPVSLCCAVVLIMLALAPGCGCFEDAVEDVTEDVIDTIIDEFFPDGVADLELDPIVIDYPADGGEPVCVTTSIADELTKLGADVGPGDFEQLWLFVVYQSYREASWMPEDAAGVNCASYFADKDGIVQLDSPTIDAPESDWWHNLATYHEAQEFLAPYLLDWDKEFQACVQCGQETDEHYFEYLFRLQVITEKP